MQNRLETLLKSQLYDPMKGALRAMQAQEKVKRDLYNRMLDNLDLVSHEQLRQLADEVESISNRLKQDLLIEQPGLQRQQHENLDSDLMASLATLTKITARRNDITSFMENVVREGCQHLLGDDGKISEWFLKLFKLQNVDLDQTKQIIDAYAATVFREVMIFIAKHTAHDWILFRALSAVFMHINDHLNSPALSIVAKMMDDIKNQLPEITTLSEMKSDSASSDNESEESVCKETPVTPVSVASLGLFKSASSSLSSEEDWVVLNSPSILQRVHSFSFNSDE